MRARVVPVLLVLALVAAACGDDGDDPEASATTTTTVAEEAEDRNEEDQALAEAIVLTEDDLPEGVEWSSEPAEAEDDEGDDELRACVGLGPEPETDDPEADSPTFSSGDVTTVDSSATVAASAAQIDEEFATFQEAKFVACARDEVETALREDSEGITFGPITAERVPFPSVADGATAVRVSTTIEAEGETIPFHFDVILVKKGRVGISLLLANAPEPFPTELAVPMAEAMAARA